MLFRRFGLSSESQGRFAINYKYGFSSHFRRQFLVDNRFLYDDKFTLRCEATIYPLTDINNDCDHSDDSEGSQAQFPQLEQVSRFTSVLAANKHIKDLASLLTDGKHHDVVIVVGDREFFAHKAILAVRSTVFAAMFDIVGCERFVDNHDDRVKLTDDDADVIEQMLHFLYAGWCKIASLSIGSGLLTVADKVTFHFVFRYLHFFI